MNGPLVAFAAAQESSSENQPSANSGRRSEFPIGMLVVLGCHLMIQSLGLIGDADILSRTYA